MNLIFYTISGIMASGVGIEPTHSDLESKSPALEHYRIFKMVLRTESNRNQIKASMPITFLSNALTV